MDVGTVLSVAQTLFAALQCSELREFCSILGYESQLDGLETTVSTLKAVLEDAETKGADVLSKQAQLYVEELKDAVFDADDLLDEFRTLAQRKHMKLKQGGKVSNKLRRFFSPFSDLPFAFRMSQGVKEIKKQLDGIAENHNKYGFKIDSAPIRMRRPETCSYVYEKDIIGRDADRDKIVGMLLDSSSVEGEASFLTIVGMGGMGKTTLAQLIYHDERITKEFSKQLWVCVADEDPKRLNVKAVLAKIFELFENKKPEDPSLEWLQGQVRELLGKQRYFLVLDDVWNEDRNEWLELENFLKGGSSGSCVLVTTRSAITASIVGHGLSYELKGLSDDDSLLLFEKVALGLQEGQVIPPDFVEIGKEIVKKCGNLPLAIRVVGSLLYGQTKEKWLSFQKIGFVLGGEKGDKMFDILKFSYHQLDTPLRSCFTYCALFPKDYEMEKKQLIQLWMAQGYVVPLDDDQSMEDAGEEYFSILLKRCFFQDVEEDENGEIIRCKMHDLMHDVAKEMSRNEICSMNDVSRLDKKKIRHISTDEPFTEKTLTMMKARTYLLPRFTYKPFPVESLLQNMMCLRALDLSHAQIEQLPDSIGKLVHLRYVDLSWNRNLMELPKSVTKLYNLQTLNTYRCDELNNMPSGMGKLSCLENLGLYVVDVSNSGCVEQLEGLQALTKLTGNLIVKIRHTRKTRTYAKGSSTQGGGYLMNKEHLTDIDIGFETEWAYGAVNYEEELMEKMQPHPNLRSLRLSCYDGGVMPRWATEANFAKSLPNLTSIHLAQCFCLEYLPPLGKLLHLKVLRIEWLWKLQYMEENRDIGITSEVREGGGFKAAAEEDILFFPSLVELKLLDLPELKGWRRGVEIGVGDENKSNNTSSMQPYPLPSFPQLLKLEIRNCHRGLPTKSFRCLTELSISVDSELERLEEVGEVCKTCSSSLRKLQIRNCWELRSLSGGLDHLTALEELCIARCPNLRLDEYDYVGTPCPWQSIALTLRSLKLGELPLVVNLPEGMKLLSSLQVLHINSCKALETLPEWIPDLTSLTELRIKSNSKVLKQRCSSTPPGDDWFKIKHIPHFTFTFITY